MMGTRKRPRFETRNGPQRRAREVAIAHPSYQPTKAGLEADMRVEASFEEAVDALTRPVRVRYVEKP